MPSSADPVIRVRGMTCRFGAVTVLQDVSFDVSPGEIFVILGGSGSGKSTVLRHLIGLYEPIEGSVEIFGESLVGKVGRERGEVLRQFGVLYQSGALFSSMTLAQNVALPLQEFTDLPATAIAQIVSMKLEMVSLGGYEEYLPSEISGGMQKRAGIARALALDPKLLFFDEPSAGLDPITSAELDELILNLRESLGTTMCIVTHELSSIYTVADRCIMLDKARRTIVAEGRPKELRDHSTDPFVRAFFRRKSHAVASDDTGGET